MNVEELINALYAALDLDADDSITIIDGEVLVNGYPYERE